MKRLHVHVSVDNLAQSIRFYSTLFAADPTIAKPDYAKWMLDDPRVNFAISARTGHSGLDHLGIQVETSVELQEVYGRLRQADRPVVEVGAATAATPSRKRRGSPTRKACRGRPSSPRAKARSTAIKPTSA
jgi:catechol 2,3-dioxygenase-like lactoylglutathione lyase family enzyme